MATYCMKCPRCGQRCEVFTREDKLVCGACIRESSHGSVVYLVRDYKSEDVTAATAMLKIERESGGRTAVRDLFLPTAKDFAGPKDPDGVKGLQKWGEEHGPRDGNTKPHYPDIPRKSW